MSRPGQRGRRRWFAAPGTARQAGRADVRGMAHHPARQRQRSVSIAALCAQQAQYRLQLFHFETRRLILDAWMSYFQY